MQKFKLPQNVSDLSSLIYTMRRDASAKLSKFCTQQILDKRLSTKTFNYEFDISGSRSGAQRKSVQKLKEILYKHVKKQIPYVEYIRSGEQFVDTASGRSNRVVIKLESPYFPVSISREHPDFSTNASDLKWWKSTTRYCKFLRYKAISNGIPISTNPSSNYYLHPDDMQIYDDWWHKKEGGLFVRVKIEAIVHVELVQYQYRPYEVLVSNPDSNIRTYEDYEQDLIRKEDWFQLKRFRQEGQWNQVSLTSRSRLPYYPGAEKYNTAEKVFLVLDDMIKVLTTFTRRVQYDTSAFNIGSIETT